MKNKRTPSELDLHNIWSAGTIGLIVLAVVIIIVMIIAWAMPEGANAPVTSTMLQPTPPLLNLETGIPTPVITTSRENVGYGDGIIVFSSVLILLLLILVLRELIIHRKRMHTHPEKVEPLAPDSSEKVK